IFFGCAKIGVTGVIIKKMGKFSTFLWKTPLISYRKRFSKPFQGSILPWSSGNDGFAAHEPTSGAGYCAGLRGTTYQNGRNRLLWAPQSGKPPSCISPGLPFPPCQNPAF